jgi:hypothetical protein
MKTSIICVLMTIMATVLVFASAGTAISAGTGCDVGGWSQGGIHETVKGVLALKEGHGEFLVRMADGNAQRFSIRAGAGSVEIIRNGKQVRFSELKVSDTIRVKFTAAERTVIQIRASGS